MMTLNYHGETSYQPLTRVKHEALKYAAESSRGGCPHTYPKLLRRPTKHDFRWGSSRPVLISRFCHPTQQISLSEKVKLRRKTTRTYPYDKASSRTTYSKGARHQISTHEVDLHSRIKIFSGETDSPGPAPCYRRTARARTRARHPLPGPRTCLGHARAPIHLQERS